MKSSQKPISLYIHWPYCLSKCPYCDFSSRVCANIDEDLLWQGYQRDLAQWLSDRPIGTIFFGGGTPSLMSVSLMDKLLNKVSRHTSTAPNCEITLEANPDAINKAKMKDFKTLGINRLSLGVQALNEQDLHFLGRRHTVQTALQRITEAQSIFDRINIDLIYARPNQSCSAWESELRQALTLGLSHYSLYQLTIEPNTVFGKQGVKTLNDEAAATLYRLTDTIMSEAGCPAYEVSNYAIPGQECRHNLVYWLGQDYIGIGPAAHGRIGFLATQNPKSITTWLRQGTQTETLTPKQKEMEQLLMGLRLRHHWFPSNNLSQKVIKNLSDKGLIESTPQGIRPTLEGTLILDSVIASLIP